MKAYLMYKDRDFDAQQELPSNAQALTEDLELNTIFYTMAMEDKFLFEIAQKAVLTGCDDLETIRYRQDVLRDCLKNPTIVRELYQIPIEAKQRRQKHWLGIFSRYPGGILSSAISLLELFISLLKQLKHIADEHASQFESDGFKRFFAMIQSELGDDYFVEVENHLKTLRFYNGVLVSAELGRGNEGTNYVLRKQDEDRFGWLKQIFTNTAPVYTFRLHPRDDHGARALGELRDKGINLVANAVAQSADHIGNFLKMLQTELAFYVGCINLYEQLDALEEPVTFPLPAAHHEREHAFSGLYDPCLALTMKKKVVGNELQADRKDLAIITGANQGGKSTFLRSIGVAQLMMQCGMFVPAESFSANLCQPCLHALQARGRFHDGKRQVRRGAQPDERHRGSDQTQRFDPV